MSDLRIRFTRIVDSKLKLFATYCLDFPSMDAMIPERCYAWRPFQTALHTKYHILSGTDCVFDTFRCFYYMSHAFHVELVIAEALSVIMHLNFFYYSNVNDLRQRHSTRKFMANETFFCFVLFAAE